MRGGSCREFRASSHWWLRDADVGLFRAEDRVFDAMLDGWKAQMLARGLTTQTIEGRCRVLKQTVTVTIEFLNWLHDHGIALEELRQEHLDVWLADGPSTCRFIDRFIPWAIKCRLVDPELTIARHRRGTSPKLPKSEQDAAVERVVHTDELTVRDRAAAILVIVFGQHIEDVVQLTWDDVTVTDDVVTIRLGKTEFALPSPWTSPCASSLRRLATT